MVKDSRIAEPERIGRREEFQRKWKFSVWSLFFSFVLCICYKVSFPPLLFIRAGWLHTDHALPTHRAVQAPPTTNPDEPLQLLRTKFFFVRDFVFAFIEQLACTYLSLSKEHT